MSRTTSHKIESKGKSSFVKIVNDSDCLFRDISDRDYGIDGMIEVFSDSGKITGQFALVQIKSTSNEIRKNKRTDDISVRMSTSSLKYSTQLNIPFILIYNSLKNDNSFYYLLLNGCKFNEKQKSNTLKIPLENKEVSSVGEICKIITSFYIK